MTNVANRSPKNIGIGDLLMTLGESWKMYIFFNEIICMYNIYIYILILYIKFIYKCILIIMIIKSKLLMLP